MGQPGQPAHLCQPPATLSLPPPPLLGKGPVKGSRKEAATSAAVSPVWGLSQPPPPHLHHQILSVAQPATHLLVHYQECVATSGWAKLTYETHGGIEHLHVSCWSSTTIPDVPMPVLCFDQTASPLPVGGASTRWSTHRGRSARGR
jgi:hypothetical protein